MLAGEDQNIVKYQKCQILTLEVEVIIAVASLVALILLCLVLYIWKKNQKYIVLSFALTSYRAGSGIFAVDDVQLLYDSINNCVRTML